MVKLTNEKVKELRLYSSQKHKFAPSYLSSERREIIAMCCIRMHAFEGLIKIVGMAASLAPK